MTKICIIEGDITKQKVDAIVNAANKTLLKTPLFIRNISDSVKSLNFLYDG